MRQFIYKILFFSFLITFGYTVLYTIANKLTKSDNDYMAAIIDKHKRIDSIKLPKIIFAGGSNLPFGIDSKMIQDTLQIPVVNLGLHAGLGLDFMLNELQSCIKNGDIIVISTEYFLDNGDYNLKKFTEKIYPKAQDYYTKNYLLEIQANIENTRNHLKALFKQKKKNEVSVYSRESFNMYGDIAMQLTILAPKNIKADHILHYHHWEGIQKLNDFNQFAKSKNVNVFFVYPAYQESKYLKNKTAIAKLNQDMKQQLQFKILGQHNDFIMSDSLFFDTTYHLISEGRTARSKKIIELLQKEKLQ